MSARAAPVLLVVGALLALSAAGASGARVGAHEAAEQQLERATTLGELAGAEGATSRSGRLAAIELAAGDDTVFELCAEDGFRQERWRGAADLLVWETGGEQLLVRTTLDAEALARARRGEAGGCLTVGEGGVPWSGTYAFDCAWQGGTAPPPAIAGVPLTVRVLARRPLDRADALFVALAFAGALLVIASLFVRRPAPFVPPPAPPSRLGAVARLSVATLAALAAAIGLTLVPGWGAAGALARGIAFGLVEIALAFALVPVLPGGRAESLGLVRPKRGVFPVIVVAGVAAAALAVIATVATRFVPSTGEAPIETFVSWPSGRLSFATLAVLAPIAEEIFFRGLVYGTAERFGRVAAFVAAAGLFTLAHAPQGWGSWGGLVAVAAAAIGLTALRAWTGSIAVPAAAHLLYNGSLAIGSFG